MAETTSSTNITTTSTSTKDKIIFISSSILTSNTIILFITSLIFFFNKFKRIDFILFIGMILSIINWGLNLSLKIITDSNSKHEYKKYVEGLFITSSLLVAYFVITFVIYIKYM